MVFVHSVSELKIRFLVQCCPSIVVARLWSPILSEFGPAVYLPDEHQPSGREFSGQQGWPSDHILWWILQSVIQKHKFRFSPMLTYELITVFGLITSCLEGNFQVKTGFEALHYLGLISQHAAMWAYYAMREDKTQCQMVHVWVLHCKSFSSIGRIRAKKGRCSKYQRSEYQRS